MTTFCISGSRTIFDSELVRNELDRVVGAQYLDSDLVIFGDAAGVDAIAESYCLFNEMKHEVYPADWVTHGKAAGPIRNREMMEQADVLVAFWDGVSRGTRSAIEAALQLRRELHVFIVAGE